jgi:hypothetical protein
VQARSNDIDVNNSSTEKIFFYIQLDAPAGLTFSENLLIGGFTSGTFSWEAVEGADYYELYIQKPK